MKSERVRVREREREREREGEREGEETVVGGVERLAGAGRR